MCDCTGSPCFPASHPQRQARRWCGGSQWGAKSASQSPRFGFCFNCWQGGHLLTAYSNTRNPDLVRQRLLASSSRSRDPAHRQPANSQWLLRCRANQKSPVYQGPKKIKFKKECWCHISIQTTTRVSAPSHVFWITTIWTDKQVKMDSRGWRVDFVC